MLSLLLTYPYPPLHTPTHPYTPLLTPIQMLSLFAGLFSVTEATTLCKAYGDASFDSVTMTTLITLNVVEEVPYHIDDRCRPSQYRVNTFIRSKVSQSTSDAVGLSVTVINEMSN